MFPLLFPVTILNNNNNNNILYQLKNNTPRFGLVCNDGEHDFPECFFQFCSNLWNKITEDHYFSVSNYDTCF